MGDAREEFEEIVDVIELGELLEAEALLSAIHGLVEDLGECALDAGTGAGFIQGIAAQAVA